MDIVGSEPTSSTRALLMEFMRTGGKSSINNNMHQSDNITDTIDTYAPPDDTLYYACERHQLDFDLINGILAAKPQALSVPRDRGWLPIHHAAMANSYDAVEFLLEKYPEGAFIQQDDGFLPLHMAVYFEDVDPEVVTMIINANPAAAKCKSKDGRTALHIALENPKMDIGLIRTILEANPAAASERTDLGQLPLHVCLENKICTPQIFNLILNAYPGAIEERDSPPRCRLPIHYAIITATSVSNTYRDRFADIVKTLMEMLPRNVPCGDYHGKTPLHIALSLLPDVCVKKSENCTSKASSDTESDGRSGTPLGDTDHSCSLDTLSIGSRASDVSIDSVVVSIVDIIIVNNPDMLKEKCSAGKTPLLEYIEHASMPSLDVVDIIASSNPQVLMLGDRSGLTPLHILLNKSAFSLDLIGIMLLYCPEVSTLPCRVESRLPIHVALRNTLPEALQPTYQAAKRLLEIYPGAADQADASGFLPVHLLVSRNNPDTYLLRKLLEICPHGVEITTNEEAGCLLPIHCAMMASRPAKSVIELLLNVYPEGLSCCCTNGLTPIDYLFLNMKNQFSRKNMLRSATPSLRVPSRKDGVDSVVRFRSSSSDCMPSSFRGNDTEVENFESRSLNDDAERITSPRLIEATDSGRTSAEMFSDFGLFEATDTVEISRSGVDTGDTITWRNNSVMSYFKGKTDEEIVILTLDLLKNSNYEVTDDIIVMFGSRLSGINDLTDDYLMFRGNFSDTEQDFRHIDSGCMIQ